MEQMEFLTRESIYTWIILGVSNTLKKKRFIMSKYKESGIACTYWIIIYTTYYFQDYGFEAKENKKRKKFTLNLSNDLNIRYLLLKTNIMHNWKISGLVSVFLVLVLIRLFIQKEKGNN